MEEVGCLVACLLLANAPSFLRERCARDVKGASNSLLNEAWEINHHIPSPSPILLSSSSSRDKSQAADVFARTGQEYTALCATMLALHDLLYVKGASLGDRLVMSDVPVELKSIRGQ
eukprot:142938-Amphidinium_carterae.1